MSNRAVKVLGHVVDALGRPLSGGQDKADDTKEFTILDPTDVSFTCFK